MYRRVMNNLLFHEKTMDRTGGDGGRRYKVNKGMQVWRSEQNDAWGFLLSKREQR